MLLIEMVSFLDVLVERSIINILPVFIIKIATTGGE